MSLTSKITLGVSVVFSSTIITYVHFKQRSDKQKMQQGILKDIERQQLKTANIKMLQDQIELEKILKKEERQQQQRELSGAYLELLKLHGDAVDGRLIIILQISMQ